MSDPSTRAPAVNSISRLKCRCMHNLPTSGAEYAIAKRGHVVVKVTNRNPAVGGAHVDRWLRTPLENDGHARLLARGDHSGSVPRGDLGARRTECVDVDFDHRADVG